jgi:hypothetical protein
MPFLAYGGKARKLFWKNTKREALTAYPEKASGSARTGDI